MITTSNKDHWLKEQARNIGDSYVVFAPHGQLSYAELYSRVNKTVRYFLSKNIEKGDRLLVLADHNLDFIVVINSLWFIGAIPIPIYGKLTEQEIKNYYDHSIPKFIISFQSVNWLNIEKKLLLEYSWDFVKKHQDDEYERIFDPEEICLMIYTSGSTNLPKCVEFTYNNLFSSVKSSDSFIQHTVYDCWLASLPFYHIGGFSIILRTIICGCKLILPSSLKQLDLELACTKHKPSLLSTVSVTFQRLLKDFSEPWPNLKYVFIGGEAVPGELVLLALKNFWPIAVVYGATETSSMVCAAGVDELQSSEVNAGKPLEGVDIQIDPIPDNTDISDNIGRIVIHSESIAKSYSNCSDPDKNNLKDGVFITNDIGEFDGNGNLIIRGRLDDIIISGGENISMNEIEILLKNEYPKNDFACLGVKNEKWGESYILIKESSLEDNKVNEFLVRNLARFKLPAAIKSISQIPKTELGKTDKAKLKIIFKADFL